MHILHPQHTSSAQHSDEGVNNNGDTCDMIITQAFKNNIMAESMSDNESRMRATEVNLKHGLRLLKEYRDVIAVDIGYKKKDGVERNEGEFCLIVWVKKKLPESEVEPDHLLPKEIEGVDVDVCEGELIIQL